MCWTSSPILRRGTTIVIGICIGAGGYMWAPRLCWSGRRCAWPLPLGGAGSLSGRRRLTNCCSVYRLPARWRISCASSMGLGVDWGQETTRARRRPIARAFRRLSRAWTRPAGTVGANRGMKRHHTHGCSKMGSIPATPSESARRTGPRVDIPGLNWLPIRPCPCRGVPRPVSDSGGI